MNQFSPTAILKKERPACPKCKCCFSVSDVGLLHSRSKCPMILECGHSICSMCVYAICKKGQLVCPICQKVTNCDSTSWKSLPANYHIIGILQASYSRDIDASFNVSFKKMCLPPAVPYSNFVSDTVVCDRCKYEDSVVKCMECQISLCQKCFNKEHNVGERFHDHTTKKIYASYKKQPPNVCEEHDRQYEFFCKFDNVPVCSCCTAMGSHKGHDCFLIKTNNEAHEEQVMEAVEEAKKVDRCLQHSEKTLKEFSCAVDARFQKAAYDIHKTFYDFHAILQLREQELVNEMHKNVEAQTVSIQHVFKAIEDNRQLIHSLVTGSKIRLKETDKMIDPKWIEELSELKNLPCYLDLAKEKLETQLDAIFVKPSLDATFMSKPFCFGKGPNIAEESMFQLEQIKGIVPDDCDIASEEEEEDNGDDNSSMPELEDLPPSIPSPSESESSAVTTTSTRSKSSISKNNRNHKYRDPFHTLKNVDKRPRNNFTRDRPELVTLTHIVNPQDFYVRRQTDDKTFEELQKVMKRRIRKNNKENVSTTAIKPGEMYVTFSKKSKCYSRSRVTNVFVEGSKIEVFNVDIGNKERVSMSRIYNIPPELKAIPSLAIKCSLWQILPKNMDKGWQKDATQKFSDYVYQTTIAMTLKEVDGDVLQVDLGEAYEGRGLSKCPKSVREALIFSHLCFFAQLPKVPDESKKILESESVTPLPAQCVQMYKKQSLPIKDKIMTVLVSHTISPTHFYIQQNSTTLGKIMADLAEMYSANRDDWQLCEPAEGMPCAALYTDGKWYRAEILDLKEDGNLEVYYVDFGNTEVVPSSRVRRLLQNFLNSPRLAIKCKLADVAPTYQGDGGNWSEEAMTYFCQEVNMKVAKIKVEAVLEGRIMVSLYHTDRTDKKNIKITLYNFELVKLGLASSTGPCSNKEVVEEVEEAAGPVQPKSFVECPKSPPVVPAVPRDEKGDLPYMVVHLSHIYSPDLMYAQFVDNEGDLKKVSQILQKTYHRDESSSSSPPPPWALLDVCAVLNPEDKLWYRGKIQMLADDGRVEIFMVDNGGTVVTKLDQLRLPIGEVFDKPAFSFACRLVGVLAPGGGKKWPFVAVEYLQELSRKYKPIYLKKMCETTDALMVKMFAKEIKKPEALEPAKETIIWFSEALVEKGLALPAQRQTPTKPTVALETVDRMPPVEASPTATVESKSLNSTMAADLPLQLNQNLVDKTWMPPVYNFKVGQKTKIVPTYVNYSGEINFHEVEDQKTLDFIKNSLKEKYEGTEPQAHDLYWYEGQMCVAQFEMDLGWYRAVVSKVEDTQITVLFVDYGNEEKVNPKQLRKEVILTHIPKQAIQCELPNIVPATEDGKWNEKALNYLHMMIVDKICNAVVMALPKGENPKFSISTIPYQTMENNMIEMKFAKAIVKVPEVMLPDAYVLEDDVDEPRAVYKSLEPPPFGELFSVVVTEVVQPNEFYVQRVNAESVDPTGYHKEIIDHCEELERYSDWMNAEAESWLSIPEPKEGLVCCAKYVDDSWFRAIVREVDKEEDRFSVFYVDYGNVEWVTADMIRALPKELLELPEQAIRCQLHQVAPVNEWNDEVMAQFKTIYEGEENLYAIIKDAGPPVQVDLLISTFGPDSIARTELAYQSMIDSNVIKMVIQKKESL